MTSKEIVSIQDVQFSYSTGHPVLEDVNFSLAENTFLGLIGPNGGGKTTLLKLILGLLTPDSGTIRVFGEEPKQARDRIGYVPQYAKIDLGYPITVLQVVLMGLLGNKSLVQRYSKEDKEKAAQALESLGISHIQDSLIGELSGGQRQRVLIARALVRDPELLILDEPTSSVDAQSETDFFKLLKELNGDRAIIVVSHDVGMISAYINKVACMNKKLYFHDSGELNNDILKTGYKCELELLGHGLPHRVLKKHEHGDS